MNEKNSFILYVSYLEQVSLLSDEQAGILFKAIFHHVKGEAMPDMDGMTAMAFSFIRSEIDKNTDKYQKTCEARRNAGKKGGRPPREKSVPSQTKEDFEKQTKAKKANGFPEKQTKAKKPDNEYEYDNDDDLKKKDTDVSKEKSSRFFPPTLEEVALYCQEKGYDMDPECFVDFYESKGWMIGKNRMKDWKAAVRNWNRSQRQESTAKGKKESRNRFNNFKQRENDYESMVFGDIQRRFGKSGT